MFPICNKKDFENFLILSMIVGFALTLLSRGSSLWINQELDAEVPETFLNGIYYLWYGMFTKHIMASLWVEIRMLLYKVFQSIVSGNRVS